MLMIARILFLALRVITGYGTLGILAEHIQKMCERVLRFTQTTGYPSKNDGCFCRSVLPDTWLHQPA